METTILVAVIVSMALVTFIITRLTTTYVVYATNLIKQYNKVKNRGVRRAPALYREDFDRLPISREEAICDQVHFHVPVHIALFALGYIAYFTLCYFTIINYILPSLGL